MQQAPSVEYPLGNARPLRRFVLMAWLVVALTDLGWMFMADFHGWRVWLGLALTLLTGAFAFRIRPRACTGAFFWDGGSWSRRDGAHEVSGRATVHLDLQSALLVSWNPAFGAGTWCWLDSTADPSRWLAVRRALFAPDPAGGIPGDGVRVVGAAGQT
jgi:toxin CptA